MWLSVQHLQIKLECVVYSRIVTQMGFVWGQVGGGGGSHRQTTGQTNGQMPLIAPFALPQRAP